MKLHFGRSTNSLCVIPARGGSKRIPHKNIRLFRGRPIIEWSIKAAQQSKSFSRIIVSTDNQEIASIAENFGADVPFLRPDHLSDDFVGTREVTAHSIEELSRQGSKYSHVCCLYATAPFVEPADLLSSFDYFLTSRAGSVVFSATSYAFPIQRALSIDSQGYCSPSDPSAILQRSQDLEEFFHDAGQFYWASPQLWCSDTNLFDTGRPYLLPRWRVQDIDTLEDWKRAELMHQAIYQ